MENRTLKTAPSNCAPSVLCEHLTGAPQEETRYQIHAEFEIFLFIRGDVHYIVEHSIYPLRPGDILIFNSTELHYPTFLSEAEYERISIHFNPALVQQLSTSRTQLLHRFLARPQGKNNLIRLSIFDLKRFHELAMKLTEETRSRQWGADILAKIHLAELLLLLENGQQEEQTHTALSPYVQQVLDYIDSTLPAPIALADVAAALSIDRFHLNKVFKREMGTTVYNFVLLKRLNLARSYLVRGDSVGDACSKAGFNDYTNFIRTFKKYTGVTPSAYARLAPYHMEPETE